MHIRKLPSGRWRVIVKHAGQQRTATADTKSKAQARGAELLLELGKAPTGGTATLGEMLHLHLAEQGYAETTLYDLGLIVSALPEDVMGWRVSSMETFTIEALYRRLRKDGWTVHRIRKLHMLLSSAWSNRAGPYGWSQRSVMRDARAPRADEPEIHPPTDTVVRSILGTVEKGVLVFFRLAAASGARRGELCGLQWTDLDLDKREMVLRRSAAYVPGKGLVVTEGKTGRAGHRVVGLDPATVDVLAGWSARQHELAQNANVPCVWVFSHDAGVTPWRGDYATRAFNQACKRAGVEDVHLHSLRHWMATTWLLGGEAPLVVAGRLGHASTTTTLRVYANYIGAGDHEAAGRHAGHLEETP